MISNVRCWTPPAVVPLIVILWLSARAMVSSYGKVPCPPVVEQSASEQAIAAAELDALSQGAVAIRMLEYCAIKRGS